ncbi:MAG TPA: ATP synthase F1 subunit gamma [Ktedonobacterales bacterium]|jgi:F-type H+-transporting ATPase subunit gamma|nr:ATP synthase F1 subunit gamma [Ktedonobacterales bacterium]
MASTQEIRRRIRSVRNVAQITRAVQLVASSKMRRAQERVVGSRPYAEQLAKLLSRVAAQADDLSSLPLMQQRDVKRVLVVVMTPDRGLAGALNSNINRRAGLLAQELRRDYNNPTLPITYVAVGRKGRDFLTRTRQVMLAEFTGLGDQPKQADVRAIARTITDAYISGEVDRALLVYPKYVSTVTQTPTVLQLLPAEPPEAVETEGAAPQYILEPDAETIFAELLPRYVETQIYQPLLETVASFYSAQMLAMKNATDSANDLLADLTLTYNKVRQSAITTQILEVVSGANALQ